MQQAEEDAVEASESSCEPWEAIREVVIMGLGSVENSAISRYQLALILLLAENLPQTQGHVQARDPVFTVLDKDVLRDCHCQVQLSLSGFLHQLQIHRHNEWAKVIQASIGKNDIIPLQDLPYSSCPPQGVPAPPPTCHLSLLAFQI